MPEPLVSRPLLPRAEAPPYRTYELFDAVFSARQCERIIAAGLAGVVADAQLEADDDATLDEATDIGVRDAQVAWLAPSAELEWVYRKLAVVASRANRRYGFELTGFEEDLQFTVYDRPGAFYTWHQDGLDATVAHRKLSLVVQLSDPGDYSGAELDLFQVHEDSTDAELAAFTHATTRRGSVVVFPAFEYHRVRPLGAGTRYSLVCWMSGPAFR